MISYFFTAIGFPHGGSVR